MNTFEPQTEPGPGGTSVDVSPDRVTDTSALHSDADDRPRATGLQIVRWCAGWLVLGVGGWAGVITLGWLASDAFGVLVP